ncbi:hypothetical protein IEO21_10621 [Rhodonia placenta]|uniref:Uncharacterized protein n=1 Tax=Rhodonia placenta TaxID=104341 RepID=A0A8H7NS64_9APHY|nr:hypothetical protein IEO21_10621 [Postia placenta]
MDRGVRLGHGCRSQMKNGALDPSLSGSSRETSICSWVSNACSSREQSKNSSATVGGGRGVYSRNLSHASGSFDLMSRLEVKRQGKTKQERWGCSTGSHRSDGQAVHTGPYAASPCTAC